MSHSINSVRTNNGKSKSRHYMTVRIILAILLSKTFACMQSKYNQIEKIFRKLISMVTVKHLCIIWGPFIECLRLCLWSLIHNYPNCSNALCMCVYWMQLTHSILPPMLSLIINQISNMYSTNANCVWHLGFKINTHSMSTQFVHQ